MKDAPLARKRIELSALLDDTCESLRESIVDDDRQDYDGKEAAKTSVRCVSATCFCVPRISHMHIDGFIPKVNAEGEEDDIAQHSPLWVRLDRRDRELND